MQVIENQYRNLANQVFNEDEYKASLILVSHWLSIRCEDINYFRTLFLCPFFSHFCTNKAHGFAARSTKLMKMMWKVPQFIRAFKMHSYHNVFHIDIFEKRVSGWQNADVQGVCTLFWGWQGWQEGDRSVRTQPEKGQKRAVCPALIQTTNRCFCGRMRHLESNSLENLALNARLSNALVGVNRQIL